MSHSSAPHVSFTSSQLSDDILTCSLNPGPHKSFTSPSLHCPSHPSRAQWNPLACTVHLFLSPFTKKTCHHCYLQPPFLFPLCVWVGVCICMQCVWSGQRWLLRGQRGTELYVRWGFEMVWENSEEGKDGQERPFSGASVSPNSFSAILLCVCRHELDWA